MRLKVNAPSRAAMDVGRGDYIKVGPSRWERIENNTAYGLPRAPRDWIVHTESGATYGNWDIRRYAKAEDLEET